MQTMASFQCMAMEIVHVRLMSMTTTTMTAPRTLRDLFPQVRGDQTKAASIVTNVALMVGFALFTAAMAQVSIKLSFTPVPITGQTLAVLLSGATLGTMYGAGSQIIYLLSGLFLPFYADQSHGWDVLKGGTGGYIVGFIVAAALVGYLSERKNDRNVITATVSFVAASAVIYIFGALWLAHVMDIPVFADLAGRPSAVTYGVAPFVVGDIVKAALAGLILPGSWLVVSRIRKENSTSEQ